MKQAVEVKIMGQSFTVASDEGEEHVRRAAELVDAKMREASAANQSVTTLHLAILAALNIASEYQKLAEEQAAVQRAIDALVGCVSGRLKES